MTRITVGVATRLIETIERFAGKRVAVLGDFVADEFVYGDIERVSREAPVLILAHRRTDTVPGGGANSVVNLASLGAHVTPVGVVGRDEAGRRLLAELRRRKIPLSKIREVASYATPTKSRILAGGVHTRRQQIVRIDGGAAPGELPSPTAAAVRRALVPALGRVDGLLVADYGYGAASPESMGEAVADAVRRELTVTVDSRQRIRRFRGVTACTPNQEELETALGVGPLDDDAVPAAGSRFLRNCRNRAVLVTRGAKGMTLFERRRPPLEIPAYGVGDVADVTGAGDTVSAVFTLALIAGATIPDAARLSNYAAGLVVAKTGTACVERSELTRAVRESASP